MKEVLAIFTGILTIVALIVGMSWFYGHRLHEGCIHKVIARDAYTSDLECHPDATVVVTEREIMCVCNTNKLREKK